MSPLAWLVALAVLALGSAAVAQPGLIIDPWGAARVRAQQPDRFRVTQRVHALQASNELIVDPWGVTPSRAPTLNAAERTLAARGESERKATWVSGSEIVDPWPSSQRTTSMRFDTLIVDPWRR